MKKVLLPTDFSSCARNAAEYAIKLFGFTDVEYTLLNTYYEPSGNAEMMVSLVDNLKQQSQSSIDAEFKYLFQRFGDKQLNIKGLSQYGNLSYALEDKVSGNQIDYVVMGTKGASGFKKFFSGSNASDVINDIKCPLLIVPEQMPYIDPVRIGLSTNFQEWKNLEILEPLKSLIHKFDSEVRVITIESDIALVHNEKNASRAWLENELQDIPHLFYKEELTDVKKGISDFVDNYEIDILVMIAKHRNFFERMFHSSMTRQMAMLTNTPLLILYDE